VSHPRVHRHPAKSVAGSSDDGSRVLAPTISVLFEL
jgi:hypothetical protein